MQLKNNKENEMKKIIKITTIALASTVVLAGCSGKKEAKKASNADYSIATVRWSDWGKDFLKGFITDSEKEFDISADWDIYLNADWADKKAVLLAGGDLPDVFIGSNALSESEVVQNQSLFLELDDYIDKYMPNFKSIIDKDPGFKALATSADGHIYGLPAKLPMRPIIGNQLFINKKWLDNLGLEVPQTYEEFVNVLEQFKAKDANGNGDVNDEIPYGGTGNDAVFGYILPFNNRFGASYGMTLTDGKPDFTKISENYKKGISEMNKAFKDGLIDSELFTQDSTMAEAKAQNPDISRVGVARGWTADAIFGIHANEYVALPALQGPDGNRYVESDPDHYNLKRNEALVLKAAKNPEKLLKWLDSFYTDDASIQNFYGSFNIGTEKNDDGTYTVLPPKDGESADISAWTKSLRDFGPKYVSDDFNSKVKIDETSGDGLKLKLDSELKQYALPGFPNVSYTNDELNKLSTIYADIDSYVSQMTSKWITEGGVDKEWSDYISQLNKMGLKDFMKIQNEAFSRYESATK